MTRTNHRSTGTSLARLGLVVLLLAVGLAAAPAQAAPLRQDPTPGPIATFNDGSTWSVAIATLSPTKFVVAYRDQGNSHHGTAVVGDVGSGGVITFGAEYVFNAADTLYLDAAALSATKFVVAYRDGGNSDHGTAIAGDVTGNTIAYGSEYVFNAATTYTASATALSATKFVVAYRDGGNSNHGTAIVGDVTGNVIAYGSEYVFNAADTIEWSVAALSATKFVVSYRDMGNGGHGTAIVGDVTGNAIAYGSEYVFNPSNSYFTSVAALSATKFVVVYGDAGSSGHGTAIVGDVTGNAIAYGSEYVFKTAYPESTSVAALSDSRFVVGYVTQDAMMNPYSYVRVGVVTGNAIAYGSETDVNAGSQSEEVEVTGLDGNFAVGWVDMSDSQRGKARVCGGADPTAVTVAQAAAVPGASVPVLGVALGVGVGTLCVGLLAGAGALAVARRRSYTRRSR